MCSKLVSIPSLLFIVHLYVNNFTHRFTCRVMGPTSLIVTACVAASKENDGEHVSAFRVAQKVIQERGIRGLYRGSPAVAMRQVNTQHI